MGPAPKTRIRDARGVTLIELVVTISVAAILMSIAAPNFSQFTAERRIRAAATDLQTALMVTRSEAIKRRRNMTLAPRTGGWQAGIQLVNPTDSTDILLEKTLPDGVTITSAPPAGIVYRPSGRATAQPTIRIASSRVASATPRCLQIELGGQPTLRDCPSS